MTSSPIDLADPALAANPYPALARLRTLAPVCWYEPLELWLLSRHTDVDAVLRDRRFGRVWTPVRPQELPIWNRLNADAMLEKEPPAHTAQRQVISRAFSARRVEELRPRIRALAAGLVERGTVDGGLDVIAALAEPLPVEVVADLLDVPEQDRPLLRPWSRSIVALYEPSWTDPQAHAAETAAVEFDGYLRGLLDLRRRNPGTDLLSVLVVAGMPADEVVATAVLLLNAGHEATVAALGNGLLALLRAPEQLARLRAQPKLLAPAVEELLRIDPPLQLFQRTALAPAVVGEVELPVGSRVGLLLGAAAHDPEVFVHPDRLDVARTPNPHVCFGGGVHFCLGAHLARIELQEALAALLATAPALTLAVEPQRPVAFQFRGLPELHVRL